MNEQLLLVVGSFRVLFRTGPVIPAPRAVYTRVPPKSVTSRLVDDIAQP
jgi:hypothetical protein